MSVLDDILRQHRRRIIQREEAAFAELLREYEMLRRELRRIYDSLGTQIRAAKAAGGEVKRSWLFEQERLSRLLEQVGEQVSRFGGKAAAVVEREQRAAIQIAIEQARETFRIIADQGSRSLGTSLPTRAIENAVGSLGNGSALTGYFMEHLPTIVTGQIRGEIIKAVALGTDFRTVARRLMQVGDIPRYRALATARTEVNRIRRETTRQIFEENPDIVMRWEWVAAKSTRTCAICLALDGKTFAVRDPFPQHINCRCTMIAVIEGIERPPRLLGKDYFESLGDDEKAKILGDAEFEAYSSGQITLLDLVGWKTSKLWGKSVYKKKLADVL
jgi:SPP1 gp7 family putative phage head morphogenesis protein